MDKQLIRFNKFKDLVYFMSYFNNTLFHVC